MMQGDSNPADQWVQGDGNIQISHVSGSEIQVTLYDKIWNVPLEPAVVPVGKDVSSPSRVIRARSGVIPYLDRGGHLKVLSDWMASNNPFAICLLAGRGGSGKTRLGVELCERARSQAGWLSGLLQGQADPTGLADLVHIPNPKLIVIDYAESRRKQLEMILPQLKRTATIARPVRVLLLVRAVPQRSGDWTEALRGGSEWLESTLDDVMVHVLDDDSLDIRDRSELFDVVADALSLRRRTTVASDLRRPDLATAAFDNSLMVVVAAYLAVYGNEDLPATRRQLLEGLTQHEDRYWTRYAVEYGVSGLDNERNLLGRRRLVGLATLAGAADVSEGAQMLSTLPEFSNVTSERRHELAGWVHVLYDGLQYWNPLEPDLLGEYVISSSLRDSPKALQAVLNRPSPESLLQPLETYGRSVANDVDFADVVRPVIGGSLARLCTLAAEQAAEMKTLDKILVAETIADALRRLLSVLTVQPSSLKEALRSLPNTNDVLLNALRLELLTQLIQALRSDESRSNTSELENALGEQSALLSWMGRHEEAMQVSQESLDLYRESMAELNQLEEMVKALAEEQGVNLPIVEIPPFYPGGGDYQLALTLNDQAMRLSAVGRASEALEAIKESEAEYRKLKAGTPSDLDFQFGHADALGNLAMLLSESKKLTEGLAAATECVQIYKAFIQGPPREGLGPMASIHNLRLSNFTLQLNIFASLLSDNGYRKEAILAIDEAEKIGRQLAHFRPSAYEWNYALMLQNYSVHLAKSNKFGQALQRSEEAVEVYKRLATAAPSIHTHELAEALRVLSIRLREVGRHLEADRTMREAQRWASGAM